MRIAVIGPLVLPNPHGGMSRHCEEVYSRLVEAGHDVTVFVRRPVDRDEYRGLRLRGVRVITAYGWDRLSYSLAASVRAATGNFDVVHYHSIAVAGFSFVPRLFRTPVVVTVHRFEWQDEKWGAGARLFLRLSERIAMRFANARIAVSASLASELERRYPSVGTIRRISNGITTPEAADPGALERFGLPADAYLLCVGRLVPEKGFDVAVDAMARLDESPDPILALVGGARGSGDYADRLSRRADRLGGRVRLLGTHPSETLATLYSHARAFVAPSFHEGQPLTVLEAMSHGCCVVASDIPAHRELLGEAGLLFPAGDVDALAAALQTVMRNAPRARELGALGRRMVEQDDRYSWSRTADETEAVLGSVCANVATLEARSREPVPRRTLARRRDSARIRWRKARIAARRSSASARALPDFLIVGAQKSGTSTLYALLAEHPQVEPALWKEVHYFDTTRADAGPGGVDWYRAHFPRPREGRVTGEASPFYLVHPAAPARVHRLVPDVKLIAILRDPVERAVSGYHHAVRMGFEDRPIETALDPVAEEPGSRNPDAAWFDRDDCPVRRRGYLARGRYAEQLERWFDEFARDQLLVLETTQLRDGTALRATSAFLGLDDLDVPHTSDRNVRHYPLPDGAIVRMLADYYAPHNARLWDLLGTEWAWRT